MSASRKFKRVTNRHLNRLQAQRLAVLRARHFIKPIEPATPDTMQPHHKQWTTRENWDDATPQG